MNVLFDATWSDDRKRQSLYDGHVFVVSPTPSALALVTRARELLEAAFAPHHPTQAQYHLSVADYAAILGKVKPAFIHDPLCKRLIPQLVGEVGGEPSQVYFDVPRMRSATAHEYLTTGIAYAFHPHRDTWYSAPQAQLNWWFPIYELDPDNGMAFYPQHFASPVPNSSETYNYYRWNRDNRAAARHARSASTDSGHRPRPGHPRRHADWRDDDLLRATSARHRSEHHRRDPFQHRLSNGSSRRSRERAGGAARRLQLHRHFDARLFELCRLVEAARRSHCTVRR
jgi:hypothetical protein